MQGLIDLHSHTVRCCHASGALEAYVERARALGLRDFGVSDHSHWMLNDTQNRYSMLASELDDYVRDVEEMKSRFDRGGAQPFNVRLGMEMDFIPSRLVEARAVQGRYAWDYVIGSVHNIGFEKLQMPQMYEQWTSEDICELYFHQLAMMLRERYCDIVGHLDLPKKMGYRPARGLLPYVEALIPDLLAAGCAVEINTSGLDSPAGEFMPGWDVVAALAAAGVPLTLGSDAHAPQQVGRHFDAALAGLRRVGVRQLVRFERRQPIAVEIPDHAAIG